MRIAIVGDGLSALVAAEALYRRHEVTLFTVAGRPCDGVPLAFTDGDHTIELDPELLAYDAAASPSLTAFFGRLAVATRASRTSFAVECRRCGVVHASGDLFGRGERVVDRADLVLLRELMRFRREARAALDRECFYATSLTEWLDRGAWSGEFLRHFLLPLGAALFGVTPGDVGRVPFFRFLRCLAGHCLLHADVAPAWRTVVGGRRAIVESATRNFSDRVVTAAVATVRRLAHGIELGVAGAGTVVVDGVVLGVPADDALRLLVDASPAERQALSAIAYRASEVILHDDARSTGTSASCVAVLDDCRNPWAPLRVTHDLTRLLRLDGTSRRFLTMNPGTRVSAEHVLARSSCRTPVQTPGTLVAQQHVRAISGARATWFCGASLGIGVPEDGARSGLDVARAIDARRAAA